MALDASPSVAWLLPGHILFCMKGVIVMLHSACFRRIICLLIVCCFVFCTFGQIKARADAGIGAVLWQAGTAVGITPETAIACILVLLGVAVVAGNSDDFWGLVSQIAADIGDLITMDFTLDNGKGVELVEAWLYDGTYHFPQETIKSVHEYLLEDTVSYDADTDSLVHSGYVYNGWTTTFGEGTLDKVLTWLFCNYPAQYELANNYEKCIAIHYTDATWRYLFSNDSFQLIESDEGNYYLYPDEFVAVHVNADGSFSLATDGYGFGVSAFEEGLYYYKSRIPIDTSNLARNLDDYSGLRIVETSGPDPDDSGKDITLSMIAVTVIGATEAIESMTQIEAQTGDNSAPDVVVDLDTGEVIDANGDTADAIFGRSVAVDAETAIRQLLVDVPRRYMLDKFKREPGYFYPRGIHMFCGEQGAGKTIAAVEMITRLQKQYPLCKTITNFGLVSEDIPLDDWRQLLDYTNGHKGVVVGIDEIQNWFMSGLNKLPEQMLEVATQNRKNNRIICCTAQVFTRVNKGLREQVSMVYNPHTFLGCFTVVIKRKPVFDSEGNVIDMKYRGMYSFVHSDALRDAYDTYKVIHTLSKEGFKDMPVQSVTNVYVDAAGKRR